MGTNSQIPIAVRATKGNPRHTRVHCETSSYCGFLPVTDIDPSDKLSYETF